MNTAKQIIMNSKYREIPEALTTLELCRAFAQKDRRKVGESLRRCAHALSLKVTNKNLKLTLQEMSKNLFPESEMVRLRSCIEKMENRLSREIRGVEFTEHDFEELRKVERFHDAAKVA